LETIDVGKLRVDGSKEIILVLLGFENLFGNRLRVNDLLCVDIDNNVRLKLLESFDEFVGGSKQKAFGHGLAVNNRCKIVDGEINIKGEILMK
jgi:hypothetical protein